MKEIYASRQVWSNVDIIESITTNSEDVNGISMSLVKFIDADTHQDMKKNKK